MGEDNVSDRGSFCSCHELKKKTSRALGGSMLLGGGCCILCRSNKFNKLSTEEKFGLQFHVVTCKKCGMIFTHPRPSKDWISKVHINSKEFEFFTINHAKKWEASYQKGISIISAYKGSGRLLDVGCGTGYFANLARDAGFEVTGTDVAKSAVEFASKNFRLRVHYGDMAELKLEPRTFDIITLCNVLEHMLDPVETMRACYNVLENNGIIYLETPNAELLRLSAHNRLLLRLRERLRGDSSLIPWEHLNYFSPKTLKSLLKNTGFKIVKFYLQNSRSDRKPELFLRHLVRGFLFYGSIGKINIYFPMTVLAKKVIIDGNGGWPICE